jgi:hypothetical protein
MQSFYFSKTNLCFCLGSTNFTRVQIRLLFKTLNKNKSLNTLSAARKELDDEDIEELMNSLIVNEYLEKLEIDYNNISFAGLIHVADALKLNKSLKFISLEGNDLAKGDEEAGISELCNALKVNNSVMYVSLAHTKLTAKSAPYIMSMIKENKSLIMLDLNGNKLPLDCLRKVQEVLTANRKEYEKERMFEFEERRNIKDQDLKLREINQSVLNRDTEIDHIKKGISEKQIWREKLYDEELEKAEENERRLEKRIEKDANARATKRKKRPTNSN